jgi:hypothetical protein
MDNVLGIPERKLNFGLECLGKILKGESNEITVWRKMGAVRNVPEENVTADAYLERKSFFAGKLKVCLKIKQDRTCHCKRI